jgi:hypothetical protein
MTRVSPPDTTWDELTLWDDPPAVAVPAPLAPETIADRFAAFHASNPWVYDALVKLARDMKASGARKIGMQMLIEVVRWQYARTTTGDAFKVNNDFAAHYARLIMLRNVDLDGIFEVRKIKTP